MRAVQARRAAGDPAAVLAFDTYCHRIRKYVGAYTAVLGRVDAITFTGGVGENSAAVRTSSLAGLETLGVRLDQARNAAPSRRARLISTEASAVAVAVIPTDEELEIATQTRQAVANSVAR
jgi:acetate kinase